jgi:hypothetical protein
MSAGCQPFSPLIRTSVCCSFCSVLQEGLGFGDNWIAHSIFVWGISMARKLNELDRQAVDLLLDRTPVTDANGATMPPPAASAPVEMSPNIQNVSAVLHLLSLLPAEAPSGDLIQRTLQRIADSEASLEDVLPEESLSDSGTFTL